MLKDWQIGFIKLFLKSIIDKMDDVPYITPFGNPVISDLIFKKELEYYNTTKKADYLNWIGELSPLYAQNNSVLYDRRRVLQTLNDISKLYSGKDLPKNSKLPKEDGWHLLDDKLDEKAIPKNIPFIPLKDIINEDKFLIKIS